MNITDMKLFYCNKVTQNVSLLKCETPMAINYGSHSKYTWRQYLMIFWYTFMLLDVTKFLHFYCKYNCVSETLYKYRVARVFRLRHTVVGETKCST